jgi:hypothetical protein
MATIQLSDELLNNLQTVLQDHDEQARDAGVSIQYLAAVIGVLLSRFPLHNDQREKVLAQLFEFTQQIMHDNLPAEASPEQPGDNAFGIWKPE